ncbi:MAG: hypothetical protein J5I81_11390 [Nitrococcus mobilis]|nr:hypothetical protein [Nitrococcus mobilis]
MGSCVLPDVVQSDPHWADWSLSQLGWAVEHSGAAINPVIYAELSVWYEALEPLEHAPAGFASPDGRVDPQG